MDILDKTLAGWEDPQAALKETGAKFSGFGDVRDYYSKTMRLSIEAHLDEKYLRAHILRKSDEAGITIIIKYKDDQQLQTVLNEFVKYQDSVNEQNFKELVASIMKVSDETLAETEEGLRPLK